MTTTSINDLFAPTSGGPSLTKDMHVGDTRTATICEDPFAVQVKNFTTKEPESWPDGNAKMQLVVPVVTDAVDGPNDDGKRSLYVKAWGSQQKALFEAIKNAGFDAADKALIVGTTITVTYVEDRKHPKAPAPEKIYRFDLDVPATAAPAAQPAGQQDAQPAAGPDIDALVAAGANADALIKAGATDAQITAAYPDLGADVLAYLRNNQ